MSESSPRVLLVAFAPFPAPTGIATRLAQRIAALSNGGYTLDVLTPRTASLPHVSRLAGARVLRVPMPRERSTGGAGAPTTTRASIAEQCAAFERAVHRQLQSDDYDVIHLMDPCAAQAVFDGPPEARRVCELSDIPPLNDVAFIAGLEARYAKLLPAAHAVIVPAQHAAVEVLQHGVAETCVHVLPPSVDLSLFRPPPSWQGESGRLRVAYVASEVGEHELTFLSEAVRPLPAGSRLRITISAPLSNEAHRRLRTDPVLRDHVVARDPCLYDDLVSLFQESDAGLVLPPLRGGRRAHPRLQSMAEMMAVSIAPVLPESPELRELVPADGAMWFDSALPATLTAAFGGLLADEPLIARLRTAARETALRDFDENSAAERLLALYHSLLNAGAQTSPEPSAGERPDTNAVLRSAWSSAASPSGRTIDSVTVSQRTPSRPPSGREHEGEEKQPALLACAAPEKSP